MHSVGTYQHSTMPDSCNFGWKVEREMMLAPYSLTLGKIFDTSPIDVGDVPHLIPYVPAHLK